MTLPLGRATRPLRHLTVLVLVAVCSLALGVGAWAFWSTSGTGAGSASTGTLNPPTNVTASASGATVTVSWTPPATGSSPLGYYVTRTGAGTSAACGTSPGSLKSASPCSDTSVPDGTYTYTVTAVRNGWSATSASSASVSVANPIKLGFTSQPGNGTSQNALSPQPVVAVQTASGSTVTSATTSVTLALTSPGGATLSCTSNPVAAVAGVATFAGCNIDQAGGSYTLTATAAGLASATSDTFTVSAGNGSKLVFNTDPGNGTGGTALTTQPTVTVRDSFGNTATSSSASVTLALTTPGGATLACTSNPVTAVSGVATFAGCQVNLVGTYTLTATSGGVTSATSATFTVAAGAATRLTFTTQPSTSTVSQVAFAAQPAVTVLDAGGNTVATATDSVSLALTTPGGATLTCTLNPKTPTSGVVGFAGCKVDLVGSYTLTASASGLTPVTSTGVTITPAAANKLAFTAQPSNGNGGTALATQPVVTVRDASGNAVTTASNAVTLTLTTPGGAILACPTNPLTASSGVATYTGCKVDKAGSYTLTAAATGLTSALSTSFTVSVGAASQLGFTTQPGGGASQAVWGAQPVVAVQDAGGNTVTSATNTVTLALTNANGGTLTCTPTNSKAAVAGVATFAGCKVDKAGSYTLTATGTSLTSATSASFTITAGAASKLAFTTQPGNGTGGTALATQPTVTVQDAFGNTVVGDTSSVTLALAPATSTLTCTANPKAAVAGVA
ncbi:MAG: fibronectin type III domain-containing protein, partial [Nocardioidaceae bacterium]